MRDLGENTEVAQAQMVKLTKRQSVFVSSIIRSRINGYDKIRIMKMQTFLLDIKV